MTWLFWLVGCVAVPFAVWESRAIFNKVPNDSLSAAWWAVRQSVIVRAITGAFLGWAGWHLLSPWDHSTGGWDDAAALTVGALALAATRYRKRDGL